MPLTIQNRRPASSEFLHPKRTKGVKTQEKKVTANTKGRHGEETVGTHTVCGAHSHTTSYFALTLEMSAPRSTSVTIRLVLIGASVPLRRLLLASFDPISLASRCRLGNLHTVNRRIRKNESNGIGCFRLVYSEMHMSSQCLYGKHGEREKERERNKEREMKENEKRIT